MRSFRYEGDLSDRHFRVHWYQEFVMQLLLPKKRTLRRLIEVWFQRLACKWLRRK